MVSWCILITTTNTHFTPVIKQFVSLVMTGPLTMCTYVTRVHGTNYCVLWLYQPLNLHTRDQYTHCLVN